MSFVIFDTEYTSWKGCLEHGWVGNQKKEIVQIASIKVSDKLEVLGQLNLFCKPLVNPVLSDYFVKLTNITNECIDEFGVSFNDAYNKFKEFDSVELISEKEIYLKFGITKGQKGIVAHNTIVDNHILVDFTGVNKNGEFFGDTISVNIDDLKKL